MFRKMRRTERELPERQAKEILENGSYGVLALAGDGGLGADRGHGGAPGVGWCASTRYVRGAGFVLSEVPPTCRPMAGRCWSRPAAHVAGMIPNTCFRPGNIAPGVRS